MKKYDHKSIEPKWQQYWDKHKTFKAVDFADQEKFYCLDMFPYPSGSGLHVGHPLGYTATDIICRKKRHQGANVLHPIGWDAFGLPAENYAIKTGTHPSITTKDNIKTFTRQIKALGFSYDWDREINTTDPQYFKWTQWLFLQMYKAGLLYEEEKNMAWCPSCKIVVANEEVEQGTHERCGNPVTRRSLKQWMFRITDYAERLLQDLDAPTVFLLHGWGGDGKNHWFPNLKAQFERMGCTVYAPDFPNTLNPEYSDWKTHFERQYADKITTNTIMIGHSLGCQFACRWLSENNQEIDQLILTAPPLTDCGIPEIKNFYEHNIDTEKIKSQTHRRFVLGSENDEFIPKSDFETLATKLEAEYIYTPKAGHLNIDLRPELQERVDMIEKSILDWTDKVHSMQKHWIGKSEGAEVDFEIKGEQRGAEYFDLEGVETSGVYLVTFNTEKGILLNDEIVLELQKIFKTIAREQELYIAKGVVMKDHVHLVIADPKEREMGELMKSIKGISSRRIQQITPYLSTGLSTTRGEQKHEYHKFWRTGYHFDPVKSASDLERTLSYVEQNPEKENLKKSRIFEDPETVTVFTTRPDTLFGATYFVMAPEHPLIEQITTAEHKKEVEDYKKTCASKSDLERTELNKEKTGVFTGAYAINPVNGKKIPVWIADYVMMGYGTGAIMAVPAHDERDYDFAMKFGLPITPVVAQVVGNRHMDLDPRPVVNAVIRRPDGSYLILKKKDVDLTTICGGGMAQGESFEQALRREIEEETGYVNLEIKDCLGAFEENIPLDCERIKKKKRAITGFLVELVDEKQGNRREKDAKRYDLVWMSGEEALKTLTEKNDKRCEHVFCARALGKESTCLAEHGIAINSGFLNDLPTVEAKQKMIQWLEEKNLGKRKINYKLRDWIFTRQRYWGEPIPMVQDENGTVYPLDESELPLELPKVDRYEPSDSGESPLANIREWVDIEGWVTEKGTVVTRNDNPVLQYGEKKKFTRETSTMPNWAGSSWYWLRYMDTNNDQEFCSKKRGEYWGPVDLYVGGTEHAVLHLLYARFWQKVLYDMELVEHKEPFKKLINQGLIMGEDGNKMSKSLGNVINPDEIIEQYGADTLRMYEMFMGPFDQSKSWNTGAVGGIYKFLERVWRVYEKPIIEKTEDKKILIQLHKTIKIVTEHIDDFKFNTAISQMMVLVNDLTAQDEIGRDVLETFCVLLSPWAPHFAEELWHEVLGKNETLAFEPWPSFDPSLIVDDTVTYAVQVNGKLRADFEMAKEASKDDVLAHAKSLEKVQKYLSEGEVKKEIFVPGKIVGFVVR